MITSSVRFHSLHLRNAIIAGGISTISILACIFLLLFPDSTANILGKFSPRSAEELLEDRYRFVSDVILIWTVGIILIVLDERSRHVQGVTFLRILFFERPGHLAPGERVVIKLTLLVSFLLAPVLIGINLGRFTLGTEWLRVEDGPLEYATAANFLIAAILLSYKAIRHSVRVRPRDNHNLAVLYVMALAMSFVALEEISWGQRIIGFETPETLVRINTQDEFNVHNIFTMELIGSYKIVAAVLFAISCFSFLNLVKKFNLPKKLQWLFVYLPDPSLIVMFSLILVLSTHFNFNELVEQLAGLVVVLYAVRLNLLKLIPQQAANPVAGPQIKPPTPGSNLTDGVA